MLEFRSHLLVKVDMKVLQETSTYKTKPYTRLVIIIVSRIKNYVTLFLGHIVACKNFRLQLILQVFRFDVISLHIIITVLNMKPVESPSSPVRIL